MMTGASAWLPQVLAALQRGDTLLCQDYLTSFTDWSGRLAWWHRLLASSTDVGDPRAVDHRRAEMVLAMTPTARLRFGIDGGVVAGIDAEVARGGEGVSFVADHKDQVLRRLWHWALVSAGIPLSGVEQATGKVQPLAQDDPYPSYAEACAALLAGDARAALDHAIDATTRSPGDPDITGVLASALGTHVAEELGAEEAPSPEAVDLAKRTLKVLRQLLDKQPDDPGLLAIYSEAVLALSGPLNEGAEAPGHEGTSRLVQLGDLLESALLGHPDNGRLHLCLASTLHLLGNSAGARRHAKEADRLGYPAMWSLLRTGNA